MTESRDGKVVIKDVGVENVNSMIKWMYTGLSKVFLVTCLC